MSGGCVFVQKFILFWYFITLLIITKNKPKIILLLTLLFPFSTRNSFKRTKLQEDISKILLQLVLKIFVGYKIASVLSVTNNLIEFLKSKIHKKFRKYKIDVDRF